MLDHSGRPLLQVDPVINEATVAVEPSVNASAGG
jgi:hypothetical protein